MKGVSYQGVRNMEVANHPKPKIKSPSDAILRVTTSGICDSDLPMYDGRIASDVQPGSGDEGKCPRLRIDRVGRT
jgi:threonine dehydrogenase-like Zn-dependent dehydrogenase